MARNKESLLATTQARYAALLRERESDDPVVIEARREFAFAKLSGHVAEIVSRFPPLTEAQCQHVAAMLTAGRVDRDGVTAAENVAPTISAEQDRNSRARQRVGAVEQVSRVTGRDTVT